MSQISQYVKYVCKIRDDIVDYLYDNAILFVGKKVTRELFPIRPVNDKMTVKFAFLLYLPLYSYSKLFPVLRTLHRALLHKFLCVLRLSIQIMA